MKKPKMTVGQLKNILEKYDDEHLVIIDHIEGYACPDLITEVKIQPINSKHKWIDYLGDYQIVDECSKNYLSAIYISEKE